jgi:hypothetical protein
MRQDLCHVYPVVNKENKKHVIFLRARCRQKSLSGKFDEFLKSGQPKRQRSHKAYALSDEAVVARGRENPYW